MNRSVLVAAMTLLVAGCAHQPAPPAAEVAVASPAPKMATNQADPHSYTNTAAFTTQHFELDLSADFDARVLSGHVVLQLERRDAQADTLILDTRDLLIQGVSVALKGEEWTPTSFSLDERDPILGSALHVRIPPPANTVRIEYKTQPQASGLQWLSPEQTTDKQHPFLFTQSQAIHARSWIPLQDTPQIRSTYEARIRTPKPLLAVMAAEMDTDPARSGDYRFRMPQPIPSYLIALAIGDLRFQAMSERTAIYAEPSVVARAAKEFEDTEAMMQRSEAIYGPYRWGRYDLLILPASFPYGGMENPRLTFATPTVIAGDKSLVSLVAHELAHSWSGNLVTNASWGDFWLNEGFTNHLTFRIMEEIYGVDQGNQERALGANKLKETLTALERDDDKTLLPNLAGRDPDENVTAVAYERGALFLAYLEAKFGRETFDTFLRGWFDTHAFKSVTTPEFLAYLTRELLNKHPGVVTPAQIDTWLRSPAMPVDTVWPQSDAFERVDTARDAWLSGKTPASGLPTKGWNSLQWQYFLDKMPPQLSPAQLAELDRAFNFSDGVNAVIASRWFTVAARNAYTPAYPAMERHLKSVGRMLLLRSIYQALATTEDGRTLALRIYEEARPGYHPIAQDTIRRILVPTGN